MRCVTGLLAAWGLFVTCVCSFPPPITELLSTRDGETPRPVDRYFLRLNNGIEVLIIRDVVVNTTTCALSVCTNKYFFNASIQDALTSLLGMSLYGAEMCEGNTTFNRYLKRRSGTLGFFTDQDNIIALFNVGSQDFPVAAQNFSACFAFKGIAGMKMGSIFNTIRNEVRSKENNPYADILLRFLRNRVIFRDHEAYASQYRRKPPSLETANEVTLHGFWHECCPGHQMKLVIYTDLEVEALKELMCTFEVMARMENKPQAREYSEICNITDQVAANVKDLHREVTWIRSVNKLTLVTFISPVWRYYKTNPLEYIKESFNRAFHGQNMLFKSAKLDFRHDEWATMVFIDVEPWAPGQEDEIILIVHKKLMEMSPSVEEYEMLSKEAAKRFTRSLERSNKKAAAAKENLETLMSDKKQMASEMRKMARDFMTSEFAILNDALRTDILNLADEDSWEEILMNLRRDLKTEERELNCMENDLCLIFSCATILRTYLKAAHTQRVAYMTEDVLARFRTFVQMEGHALISLNRITQIKKGLLNMSIMEYLADRDLVLDLVRNMNVLSAGQSLIGNSRALEEYDQELIRRCISCISDKRKWIRIFLDCKSPPRYAGKDHSLPFAPCKGTKKRNMIRN